MNLHTQPLGHTLLAHEHLESAIQTIAHMMELSRSQGPVSFAETKAFYLAYFAGIRDFLYYDSSPNTLKPLIHSAIERLKNSHYEIEISYYGA